LDNIITKVESQLDENQVGFLVKMINDVYIESEGNIWIDEHQRITPTRLIEIIELDELLLAYKGDEICGCIHLEPIGEQSFKFKMLVANQKFKGTGVGSILVQFAENEAARMGANTMQLELLVPTEFIHVDKVFLHDWYSRIGYHKIAEKDVDDVHKGLSKLLKTGCVAKIYQKSIG
jgi:GNAT superfamily N-acetyltransferase